MKNTIVVFSLLSVVILNLCLAEDSPQLAPDDRYIDYKLFEGISSNAVHSLYYMSQCRTSVEKMLRASSSEVSSSFIAAKMAWIFGRPSDAINILDRVVSKYGNATNEQFGERNSIVGNLWIGTISRHSGDVHRAQKSYEDIMASIKGDESSSGLSVFCYLYKAEIADAILGRRDIALENIKKIKTINAPLGQNAVRLWRIYQEWADYQLIALTKEAKDARAFLKGDYSKRENCIILAMNQLGGNGITEEPSVGFYNDDRKVLLETSLALSIQCRTSPIDKSLSQLLMADIYERSKEPAKAEEYYSALLDGDSFFAPEGGIFLAECQKKQGKAEEARKTFAKITERFPGYAKLVETLSKK